MTRSAQFALARLLPLLARSTGATALHTTSEEKVSAMKTVLRKLLWMSLLPFVSGCGGGGNASAVAPTPVTPAPAPSTPQFVQLAGLWAFAGDLQSVTGGECVGEITKADIGRRETGLLSVTQNGNTVMATMTSSGTGQSCTFSGVVGASSVVFSLVSCTDSVITNIGCPGGVGRELRLKSFAITASATGGLALNGSQVRQYDVYALPSNAFVSSMFLNGSFVASRR
jgi:hypothetical protein